MSYRVLLIDDNQLALESMEKTIPWAEHDLELVGCASNGIQGCQMIRSLHPDILISDIQMPEMDGHHLTKLVKSDEEMKGIPLIIFSSLINSEMRIKGKQLGADEQLSKPEIGHLVEVMDTLLERR